MFGAWRARSAAPHPVSPPGLRPLNLPLTPPVGTGPLRSPLRICTHAASSPGSDLLYQREPVFHFSSTWSPSKCGHGERGFGSPASCSCIQALPRLGEDGFLQLCASGFASVKLGKQQYPPCRAVVRLTEAPSRALAVVIYAAAISLRYHLGMCLASSIWKLPRSAELCPAYVATSPRCMQPGAGHIVDGPSTPVSVLWSRPSNKT